MFINRRGRIWDPGPGFCPVSFIFKEKLQTVKMLTTDNNPVRASADFHTPLCSCFYGEYRSYEDWSVRDGRGQLCYWLKRKQVISTQQILKTTRRTHLLMQRQWWVLGERGFLIYLSCSTVMEQIRMIKLVVIMTLLCLIKFKIRTSL